MGGPGSAASLSLAWAWLCSCSSCEHVPNTNTCPSRFLWAVSGLRSTITGSSFFLAAGFAGGFRFVEPEPLLFLSTGKNLVMGLPAGAVVVCLRGFLGFRAGAGFAFVTGFGIATS